MSEDAPRYGPSVTPAERVKRSVDRTVAALRENGFADRAVAGGDFGSHFAPDNDALFRRDPRPCHAYSIWITLRCPACPEGGLCQSEHETLGSVMAPTANAAAVKARRLIESKRKEAP